MLATGLGRSVWCEDMHWDGWFDERVDGLAKGIEIELLVMLMAARG